MPDVPTDFNAYTAGKIDGGLLGFLSFLIVEAPNYKGSFQGALLFRGLGFIRLRVYYTGFFCRVHVPIYLYFGTLGSMYILFGYMDP